MPDRDKVIKAIDICLGHGKCDDCGYRIKGGFGTMDCRKPMMCDALALLKEQEPVEPVPEHPVVVNTLACGVCHAQVARWDTVRGKRVYLFRAKHCPECGMAVKWDEQD